MRNPFKRKPHHLEATRQHLLKWTEYASPDDPAYKPAMDEIDRIDRIMKRTTELKKTIIPAAGTGAALVGIYALQQFAGVLVPKAADMLAARQEQKKPSKELN